MEDTYLRPIVIEMLNESRPINEIMCMIYFEELPGDMHPFVPAMVDMTLKYHELNYIYKMLFLKYQVNRIADTAQRRVILFY